MPRPSLLLVEDDVPAAVALATALREQGGYDVHAVHDGREGLALTETRRWDAIVSDVNLPGLDGLSLCRRVRERGDSTPLVLLTSRDSEIDEALGLELGADDYVTKPFSLRVLIARLAALSRRTRATNEDRAEEDVLVVGPLAIDRGRLEVRWHGELVTTTVTELRMLEALATRPGRVLSREQLLELGREDDSFVAPRIVDTYVARLRKKLDAVRADSHPIETVVGAGYRFRTKG